MTNIPKRRKTNCHTHNDGNPNGPQETGSLGFENILFPIVAKGPKPNKNQIKTSNQANGINFIFFFDTPAISDRKACLFLRSIILSLLSGKKYEPTIVKIALKKIPQPAE